MSDYRPPFKAKFDGICKYGAACKLGGRIRRGEEIKWSRVTKGAAWHVQCEQGAEPLEPSSEPSSEIAEQPLEMPTGRTVSRSDSEAGAALDLLASVLSPKLKAAVSPEEVSGLVELAIAPLRKKIDAMGKATRIEVIEPKTGEVKDLGVQHKQFPMLMQVMQARQADGHRLNAWLCGPAGSGKTTAAFEAAKALGLEYAFTGAIDTPYPLTGFVDANGKTIRTPFRERYEHGGVFLFDEYDGSHPSATLPFNAALANGHCAFPDAIVPRHKDFIAIAAANTYGLGGTTEYVGRNRLDAASLDRFVSIDWQVDEELERATVGNDAWVDRVQAVRRKVAERGIKVLITPRASYFGAALLAAGMKQAQVEQITLKKGMADAQWEAVR